MPPLGKILTADEIARFVARVAYPTSPVVLVDEDLALAAPARAYGDWLEALGTRKVRNNQSTRRPAPGGQSQRAVPGGVVRTGKRASCFAR
ncbi:hypothetical protein W59_10584 [Rhodococcus opacus RKJ300 = JCM 13270]|uniref:Uncharacterized protein n=2 Tax=Nocardiaceae TaxID=85025 RepID=I0WU82_RHOOP|nr:hypothetical protein W59_10584 [Rhodococcus opacus RKJ300 = JCM 13270]